MTWPGLEKRWEPMVERGNGDGPRSVLGVGGGVAQLGFMFPPHDCVLCRGTSDHGFGCTRPSITPALLDYNRHPNITLLTSAEIRSCEGVAGDFRVSLWQRPQYVDPALCIN